MLGRHVSSGCSRMRRNFYVGKKKKKKWRKAVKAKGAVCITKLQNYTGSQNVYRTGRLTWTG